MSEVKDTFFGLLNPKIEAHGFAYKKSTSSYIKTVGELQFTIKIKWDGRGGTTMINNIDFYVTNIAVQKAYKKLTATGGFEWQIFNHIWYSDSDGKLIIPMMYSRETLDLANDMNLRALAQIPFERRYPMPRIVSCVAKVESLILSQILPFFDNNKSDEVIFEQLCEKLDKTDVTEIGGHFIFLVKLYAKKLGVAVPEKIRNDVSYIQYFKDGFGYMNKIDFDALEAQLTNYKF